MGKTETYICFDPEGPVEPEDEHRVTFDIIKGSRGGPYEAPTSDELDDVRFPDNVELNERYYRDPEFSRLTDDLIWRSL